MTKIHTLTIYKTRTGQFRWSGKYRNGKTVAATESYTRYRGVRANILATLPPPIILAWKWVRGEKRRVYS